MGLLPPKMFRKIRVRKAFFWYFVIVLHPISNKLRKKCTLLERGESYLTFNQSFSEIGAELRELWDFYRQKKFQKNSSQWGFYVTFSDCFTSNFQPIVMVGADWIQLFVNEEILKSRAYPYLDNILGITRWLRTVLWRAEIRSGPLASSSAWNSTLFGKCLWHRVRWPGF